MKIKQKTELSLVTRRRLIVRRPPNEAPIACARCGAALLGSEQAAVLFGVRQRQIFQLIERGAAHFSETETGAVLICLLSLDAVLNGEDEKIFLNKIKQKD